MLIVTGSVTARPESFDLLRTASIAHVNRSRLEPGCISHSVQADCENPLRLFFYERWESAAALKAHFAVPGAVEFMATVRAHGASSEAVTIYEADPIKRGAIAAA